MMKKTAFEMLLFIVTFVILWFAARWLIGPL